MNISVSGFSLSSIALKKASKQKNKPKIILTELPKDPFEQKKLDTLWKKYIDIQKLEGKSNIASILSINNPKINDNFQIGFIVANEMNKVELIEEMEMLLPYLRNHLNNQSLGISISISKTIKEEAVYSPPEKYQHLLKVNPTLETLRKTFDLDF